MPTLTYLLVYCATCGEQRKIAPEKACELRRLGDLEWTEPRALKCPILGCNGRMARVPEAGEPTYLAQGSFWPINPDVEWMT